MRRFPADKFFRFLLRAVYTYSEQKTKEFICWEATHTEGISCRVFFMAGEYRYLPVSWAPESPSCLACVWARRRAITADGEAICSCALRNSSWPCPGFICFSC